MEVRKKVQGSGVVVINDDPTDPESYIAKHKVMIFAKSYCPHCKATKKLLNDKGVDYGVVEMDLEAIGPDLHDKLKKTKGQKTVPYVFIDGKLLGGNSEL